MKTNKELCYELINKHDFYLCFENDGAICLSRETKSLYPNDDTIYIDIVSLDLEKECFYGSKNGDIFHQADGLDIAEAFGLA